MTRKAAGNIDYIQGVIFPSQTYAFTGRQWGSSQAADAGKQPTDASPMVITSQPPGAFARDDATWKLTFGASHDAWLTLFNSAFMSNTPPTLSEDAWGKGLPKADDFNLYKLINETQQISYIVNKNTVQEFRDSPKLINEFSARGLGVRFPMMAAGWGKTVGLRPTDPEPGDKRKNDETHKLARETWKHGPVDIRWDSRKGMWSAFNDLITGQHKEDIGTIVFGSVGDETCGFPFLKGKLQDVWWVRKTLDFDGTIGNEDDFTQTGEVVTVLEHKFYDEETQACAPLNSIFKIPGTSHAACHPDVLGTVTCGAETTHDAALVDLRSSVHFNLNDEKDGPLNFSVVSIDPNLICSPDEGYFHQGIINFNDDGCVWDVSVKIDECDLAGGHFAALATNDVALAERLTFICNLVVGWAGGLNAIYPGGAAVLSAPEVHDINVFELAANDICLQSNINSAVTATLINAQNLDSAVYNASTSYSQFVFDFMLQAINNWITGNLRPILQACCGETAGAIATISAELAEPPGVPAVTLIPPEFLDCTPVLEPMPRLNCELCFGVHLNVPCGVTPNVFAGDACFANEPPAPLTAFGACQFHD